MTRVVTIGGHRLTLPAFAPTVFLDERSWFWTYGFSPDVLLVSCDVLAKRPSLARDRISKGLKFPGLVIVDSGGFGQNATLDPAVIAAMQRTVGADIAVALDRVAASWFSNAKQWNMVRTTVANAAVAMRLHKRGSIRTEGVIQGATPDQRKWCATELRKAGVKQFGIPVSNFSKYRQYDESVRRVLEVKSLLPRTAIIHGMGAGSRTTMAVLAYLGVEIFDSSSWFTRAWRGERFTPVNSCVFDKPRGKPQCTFCPARPGRVRSAKDRVSHNLREDLKEIMRIRCAQEEKLMPSYLERRLKPAVMKKLAPLL